jgi:hypothetical protein
MTAAMGDDPRLGRQRAIVAYLRVALVAVLVIACGAVVAPDSWEIDLGRVMVGVLIVAPVGRVVWLLVRWTRRGDRRYALAAVALLAVMGAALVLGR